jgi:hypothetical protein
VYLAICKASGRAYVGTTVRSPEGCWIKHAEAAGAGSEYPFHAALRKVGLQGFEFKVVWTGPAKQLTAQAGLFMRQYGALQPNGYNVGLGGCEDASAVVNEPIVITRVVSEKRRVSWCRSKRACLLSLTEVTRLVDDNVWPECRAHRHERLESVRARGDHKFLELSDGEQIPMAVRKTELSSWARWDWDTKIQKGSE